MLMQQQQMYFQQQQQRPEQMRQRGMSAPGQLPTLQRAPGKRTPAPPGQQPPQVQRAPSPGQVRGPSSAQTGGTFYPPPYHSSQSQNSGFSSSASLSRGQVPMGP